MKYDIVQVILNIPLNKIFDYYWYSALNNICPNIGQLVIVPFNNRQISGLVINLTKQSNAQKHKLKNIIAVQSLCTPVSINWLNLCRFTASYYQGLFSKVAFLSLPKNLLTLKTTTLKRILNILEQQKIEYNSNITSNNKILELELHQEEAVQTIFNTQRFIPFLLYEINSNNRTKFYCRIISHFLRKKQEKTIQILILVPEINSLLQIESSLRIYFTKIYISILHSYLTENERILNWLAAHQNLAHIILGTNLAVLASLPNLKLIIIDEEHNKSYKQKSGLRYSARDLAIWRAHQLNIPVILGSATPSAETWQQTELGHYHKIELNSESTNNIKLPIVRIIDTKREQLNHGLTQDLFEALKKRLQNNQQSLLFLNRRGYASILICKACKWMSKCKFCTSFMVLHKIENQLRCHRCNFKIDIPQSCPICKNTKLQSFGQGTQYIEKELQRKFPQAHILRVDADSMNINKNITNTACKKNIIDQNTIDIFIGTQMIINRYKFKCLTLIGIINPDIALFSHNYRASEYLFTQLIQIANQAKKNINNNLSEMLIQSQYPNHFLYQAIIQYSYPSFINELLKERQQAILPPFVYQAVLRVRAITLNISLTFLSYALNCSKHPEIIINDPITTIQKPNIKCAQLLIECKSRLLLQIFLRNWINSLQKIKTNAKWSIEVDPIDIY